MVLCYRYTVVLSLRDAGPQFLHELLLKALLLTLQSTLSVRHLTSASAPQSTPRPPQEDPSQRLPATPGSPH